MGEQLERVAGRLLSEAGLKLAVAESCTGGLLGSRITDVPGSSAYFLGGVLAYADALKTLLLWVPPEVIRKHGAVSAECAAQMARGVLEVTGADIAIAVTGIAGPDGGSAEKPVGTVYITLVAPAVEQVERFEWHEDRTGNKRLSVEAALQMLVTYLSKRDGNRGPMAAPAGGNSSAG